MHVVSFCSQLSRDQKCCEPARSPAVDIMIRKATLTSVSLQYRPTVLMFMYLPCKPTPLRGLIPRPRANQNVALPASATVEGSGQSSLVIFPMSLKRGNQKGTENQFRNSCSSMYNSQLSISTLCVVWDGSPWLSANVCRCGACLACQSCDLPPCRSAGTKQTATEYELWEIAFSKWNSNQANWLCSMNIQLNTLMKLSDAHNTPSLKLCSPSRALLSCSHCDVQTAAWFLATQSSKNNSRLKLRDNGSLTIYTYGCSSAYISVGNTPRYSL